MIMEASKTVGVHYDPCYERHDTGRGHPESAARYRVLEAALETLPAEIVRLAGRRALVSEILLAHEHYYHDLVYRDAETFADVLRTGDTAICEDSYDVALEATGAVLAAVDGVMRGDLGSVFCAVRPPGHHATSARGMGFCIFNHVAVAARYLQSQHGVGKVAIIDWDVHHGNGTEAIFIEDPSVLYISLHEENMYPYTGYASERGQGAGEGFNLNIPLPGNSDGDLALGEWSAQLEPAVDAFQPDFLLISAGFDARVDDPIGGLRWTDETFAEMTRRAKALAGKWCGGRMVSALEGGYNPAGLASAALAHVRALA
jgi:acetoin utilization deacetylase AcuC-like enzyme